MIINDERYLLSQKVDHDSMLFTFLSRLLSKINDHDTYDENDDIFLKQIIYMDMINIKCVFCHENDCEHFTDDTHMAYTSDTTQWICQIIQPYIYDVMNSDDIMYRGLGKTFGSMDKVFIMRIPPDTIGGYFSSPDDTEDEMMQKLIKIENYEDIPNITHHEYLTMMSNLMAYIIINNIDADKKDMHLFDVITGEKLQFRLPIYYNSCAMDLINAMLYHICCRVHMKNVRV